MKRGLLLDTTEISNKSEPIFFVNDILDHICRFMFKSDRSPESLPTLTLTAPAQCSCGFYLIVPREFKGSCIYGCDSDFDASQWRGLTDVLEYIESGNKTSLRISPPSVSGDPKSPMHFRLVSNQWYISWIKVMKEKIKESILHFSSVTYRMIYFKSYSLITKSGWNETCTHMTVGCSICAYCRYVWNKYPKRMWARLTEHHYGKCDDYHVVYYPNYGIYTIDDIVGIKPHDRLEYPTYLSKPYRACSKCFQYVYFHGGYEVLKNFASESNADMDRFDYYIPHDVLILARIIPPIYIKSYFTGSSNWSVEKNFQMFVSN
jgi:hypothetical protein